MTVPALSLSCSSLYLQLSSFSLPCSSALLFCQLYFPYLPLESALFFSPFPLSFFPFPHYIISLDSLSVSQDIAFICASLIKTLVDSLLLRRLCLTAEEQQCYCESGLGPRGHTCVISVLGEEGAAITKAVVLCLLLSPRVSLSNIRSADQQQYYGFPALNSWESSPPT